MKNPLLSNFTSEFETAPFSVIKNEHFKDELTAVLVTYVGSEYDPILIDWLL